MRAASPISCQETREAQQSEAGHPGFFGKVYLNPTKCLHLSMETSGTKSISSTGLKP